MSTYRDLEVWQWSMTSVERCYRLTETFPASERFGLIAQIRRAAVSIPSNLAEGAARGGSRVFRHFVSIALGSHAELETLLAISERLGLIRRELLQDVQTTNASVGKMLHRLHQSLSRKC